MKEIFLMVEIILLFNFCFSSPTKTCSLEKFKDALQLTIKLAQVVEDSEEYQSTNDLTDFINTTSPFKPGNCAELQLMGHRKDGIYEIFRKGNERMETMSFRVYCDFTTDGGGWTVFQRRGDFGEPQESFLRNWRDYRIGFGDLEKEFWLGNDYLSLITIQDRMILRVDVEDFANNSSFALYTNFLVEGEETSYTMSFSKYEGTAGNSLDHHNGHPFSTADRDNKHSCASSYKGGWWYNHCHFSNLNGLYVKAPDKPDATCINWYHMYNEHRCLKKDEMKLRPMYFYPKQPKK